MRSIKDLLNEYGESHRNHTNEMIHWICVPVIFFSVVGFLYSVKLPLSILHFHINAALLALFLLTLYYMRLSNTLWVGMFLFGGVCLYACHLISTAGYSLWLVCIILFVAAWIGQFYGHKVEGKKPSFLKDLQFLLIGPAWLMSFIYTKLGVKI